MTEFLNHRSISDAMKKKGYRVFASPEGRKLNIVGIRTASNTANAFGDWLTVFYKDRGVWNFFAFPATTDPGTFYRKEPSNVDGTAILKPGQYRDAYRLGKHCGYKALTQKGKLAVYRDNDKDEVLDVAASQESGLSGIDIHRASRNRAARQADKWSAGCQVFQDPDHFDFFMALCERSRAAHGNSFTYTLLEEADFAAERPQASGAVDLLTVSQGQVTFDAEGNDNPRSRYFSRKVRWSGSANSGVTLGRGYDMGRRTKQRVVNDLTAAGMPRNEARKFAEGARKRGEAAEAFVKLNRGQLGEIGHRVQKGLFENVYPGYVKRGRENYEKWTAGRAGRVEWGDLHPAVRDVLVDFVFQGVSSGVRPMRKGMHNDFDELIEYVTTNAVMRRYEKDRQRAEYLRRAKRAPSA